MKRTFAVISALLLAAPLVWSVETMAQTQRPGAGGPGMETPTTPGAQKETPGAPPGTQQPGAQKEQEVQGKVASVDPSGKSVTLEDGTKLMIPEGTTINREILKKGANVTVRFKDEGGQKVVTRILVRQGERS